MKDLKLYFALAWVLIVNGIIALASLGLAELVGGMLLLIPVTVAWVAHMRETQ